MKAYEYKFIFSLYLIHIILLYLYLLLHKMYLSTFIACKIILFYMPKNITWFQIINQRSSQLDAVIVFEIITCSSF